MKKILYLITAGLLGFAFQSQAQISQGGFPKSFDLKSNIEVSNQHAALPDWESYIKEEEKEDDFSKPYLIGLFTETNIQFPASGEFHTNENGDLIWKTALEVKNAPALGLYFDQFHLPKGVSLFIHNENQKHILGAYTEENNNSIDDMFATEAIQGEKAYIELNISNPDLIDDIKLNIDRALVYFRSYENTLPYAAEDWTLIGSQDQFGLEGASSNCMINANCSEGVGYERQKRASVQIIVITSGGAGLCSATIVNSEGNDAQTCRPLLLTASHCESSGAAITNTSYSQLLTRFNFEKDQCSGGPAATQSTMTGANFLTRSYYDPNASANQLNNDFLLLELRNKIPAHYNAYHAGIRMNYDLPQLTGNQKNIGFHHPAGDVKKLIFSKDLYIYGNTSQQSNHWVVQTNTNKSEGGAAQGSSGSGLFDGEGYYLGVASTAGNTSFISGCGLNGKNQTGSQFFNVLNYTQVQKAISYSHSNPAFNSIEPYINPNNENISVIEGLDCNNPDDNGPVAIEDLDDKFGSSIKIYPNPVNKEEGLFIQTNFRFEQNLEFNMYDIQGKLIQTNQSNHVKDQVLKLDIKDINSGMYIIEISNGVQKSSHKVLIK